MTPTKKQLAKIFMASFLLLGISCNATKTLQEGSFSKDDNGVYQAQKAQLQKGAVRLIVEIIEDADLVDERYMYKAKVAQVVSKSGDFGTVTPRKGETIMVSSVKELGLKTGEQVQMDVMTPISKEGEFLTVVML